MTTIFWCCAEPSGRLEFETEAKSVWRARGKFGGGIPLPLGRVERREIPAQDVDPQIGLGLEKRL